MQRIYDIKLVVTDDAPDEGRRFTWALAVDGRATAARWSTDEVVDPAEALEKVLANAGGGW